MRQVVPIQRLRASLLALCLAAPLAQAAEEAVQATRLQSGERIVLDGTLSHPAWRRAPVFERSYEIDPVRGRTPTHGTRIQVL